MVRPAWSRSVIVAALFGLAYFLAGKLGLALAFVHDSASPVWPPTGVAMAGMVLLGLRYWPLFALSAALLNWDNGTPIQESLIIGLGNAAEGVLGALIVRRFAGGDGAFERASGIAFFVLAALASPVVSASIGVQALVAGGLAPAEAAGSIWITWWLGDVGGAVLVAPLIIIWHRAWHKGTFLPTMRARSILVAISVAVGLAVFVPAYPAALQPLVLLLLATPILLGVSLRGSDGHAVPVVALGGIAVWATVNGKGPLYIGSENTALLMVQMFLVFLALAAMVLSAGRLAMKDADEAGLWTRTSASRLGPILVALLPLLLASGAATGPLEAQQIDAEQARFDAHVEAIDKEWEEVMRGHVTRLEGLAGLYAGSNSVSPDEFHRFTEQIGWTSAPGVLAIEFARSVASEDLAAYEESIRAAGYPSPEIAQTFSVYPFSDGPQHTIVEVIEPFARNSAAFGLDLEAEANRAEALERAQRTGNVAASASIQLVQANESGFLMMHAVQEMGVDGMVLTVHRTQGLLDALVQGLEGATAKPDLYLTDDSGAIVAATSEDVVPGRVIPIVVADRIWQAHIQVPAGLASATEQATPWAAAILGGSLSLAFASIVYAYDGTRRRALQIANDMVDAERDAERERLRAANLEAMNRFQSQFINLAAHELRTPMVPLRAQVSIVKHLVGDKVEPSLKVMSRNLDRLGRLVDDLLEASRAGASEIHVEPRPTSPHALAEAAYAEYRPVAEQKSVEMLLACKGEGTIPLDPGRAEQVLANLVGNAVKFTEPGGRIKISSVLDHGWTFSVKDNGRGIAPEDIPSLFQPFVQVHEAGTVSEAGSGLGLYICRTIIERHGGTIWAESQGLGHGTTLFVHIPPA